MGRRAQNSGVAAGPVKAIKPKGSNKMTLEQLKADHSDVYLAAKAEGKAEGIKAEQDRNRDFDAWLEPEINADVTRVAIEAKKQGKTESDVRAQLSAAAARGPKGLAGANPPGAATAVSTPSGAKADDLTHEDIKAAEMFGMTLADYAKFKLKEA